MGTPDRSQRQVGSRHKKMPIETDITQPNKRRRSKEKKEKYTAYIDAEGEERAEKMQKMFHRNRVLLQEIPPMFRLHIWWQ
jgi:hypothetical protein